MNPTHKIEEIWVLAFTSRMMRYIDHITLNTCRRLESILKSIRRLFQKLLENEFVKSVAILVSCSSVSQIIVVLLTPLLTRLYTPEAFGVLSVFISIVLTIFIIAYLHYHHAIPLLMR